MGDLAANIAKTGGFYRPQRNDPLDFDFPGMAVKARSMVRRSIDALVARDAALARQCASMTTNWTSCAARSTGLTPLASSRNPRRRIC
jgi:hypothetical protein